MSRRSARSEAASEAGYTVAERIRYWLVEERRLLLDAVSGLTADAAREPLDADVASRSQGASEDAWSVHDILAHRMFWEGRESEAIDQYLQGKRVELLDFPVKRIDGTNAAAVDTLRGQPTEKILRGMGKTRKALLELVAKLDDEQLNDDESAAQLILGVALEHDREHRKQIQAWRRQRAQQALNEAPDDDRPADPSQDQAVDHPGLDTR